MNALVPLRIGTGLPGPGRPSIYDPAIADEIIERLSNGEFMRRICQIDGMPSVTTVNSWELKRPEFAERVARARELGARCWIEQAVEITLNPEEGRKIVHKSDGGVELTREDAVAARKLAAWGLMEGAKKIAPKVYGDKVALTGGSKDDTPAMVKVEHEHTHRIVKLERAVVTRILPTESDSTA